MDKSELQKLITARGFKPKRASAYKHIVRVGRTFVKFTDEGIEQLPVIQWLQLHKIMAFHPANEGKRDPREGLMLKMLGLTPDVSDIIILKTPPLRPDKKGTIIEMKSLTGKPTPGQLNWQADAENEGFVTAICYGAKEAITFLESLGYGRKG